jgi:hypothetical protein
VPQDTGGNALGAFTSADGYLADLDCMLRINAIEPD